MKKAAFHTLGCKLNYAETLTLSRRFSERGFSVVDSRERAATLEDQVPEAVKEERRERFMALQAEISSEKLQAKIGKTLQVLVDAPGVGRSMADAPEIDGLVYLEKPHKRKVGDFVNVRIERADAHDLHGRVI